MTLAERLYTHGPRYAEPWNFGPNDEDAKPVAWIVKSMADFWGKDASWEIEDGDHPHEAMYLKLDISKARTRLNWHPLLTLKQTLKMIIDWSQARHCGADMQCYTLGQIKTYQSLIIANI